MKELFTDPTSGLRMWAEPEEAKRFAELSERVVNVIEAEPGPEAVFSVGQFVRGQWRR